jgi:MFS family permease
MNRRLPIPTRHGLARSVPVLGAFAVGAIAYAPLYCFPFMAPQFEESFGTSRELGQMPWTMFLVVSALSSPLLGHAYDVFADRLLLLAGASLLALGWLVVAAASDVSFLIFGYGIFLAIGLQLVFVGVTTAVARRYAGVAGLALGVAYAGPGIGVALALPLAAGAIPDLGWRTVSIVFAGLSLLALPFVVLMTSGAAVLVPAAVRDSLPPDSGAGLHETSAPGAIAASQEHVPAGTRTTAEGLRRTLRTRRFLILLVGAVGIGCIDEGVFQIAPRHAVDQGITAEFAATLLAIQSYAYVAGQVLGGGLSDRYGRRFVGLIFGSLIGLGATAVFLSNGGSPSLAVAGYVAYGFGIGATISIRSAAFSDVFGGHNFGAIFGVIAIAYPLGGVIVMNVGGTMYDRTGSYWLVYWVVMASLLAWTTALLVAGPRRHGLRRRLERVRSSLPV